MIADSRLEVGHARPDRLRVEYICEHYKIFFVRWQSAIMLVLYIVVSERWLDTAQVSQSVSQACEIGSSKLQKTFWVVLCGCGQFPLDVLQCWKKKHFCL